MGGGINAVPIQPTNQPPLLPKVLVMTCRHIASWASFFLSYVVVVIETSYPQGPSDFLRLFDGHVCVGYLVSNADGWIWVITTTNVRMEEEEKGRHPIGCNRCSCLVLSLWLNESNLRSSVRDANPLLPVGPCRAVPFRPRDWTNETTNNANKKLNSFPCFLPSFLLLFLSDRRRNRFQSFRSKG